MDLVIADVIGQANGRGIGETANEIAAADFSRVDTHFLGNRLDQPFHDIGRFGSACTAISVDRGCVGKHTLHLTENLRGGVLASEQGGIKNGWDR